MREHGIKVHGVLPLLQMVRCPSSATTAWTPASPTTDGGVLPHTWHYAGSGALFQDSALTTPATADGAPIGGSTNQGSDAHSIVQATAGNKPTLKLAILNGHPVYRCDGGDFLRAAFSGAVSQPNTLFLVVKLTSTGIHETFVETDALTTCIYMARSDNVYRLAAGANLEGGTTNTNWNIHTALANGASSQIWIAGGSIAIGDAGANARSGLTLCANLAGTNPLAGDMAEMLIYASNLSTADKNEVGTYLATKYALSWMAIT